MNNYVHMYLLVIFVLNRIAQLEKSLIDVNSHQKQLEYEHQIEELNLKYAVYITVHSFHYKYVHMYIGLKVYLMIVHQN